MAIELAELPLIDLAACVNENEFDLLQCELVAKCLHEYGVIVVKDPVRRTPAIDRQTTELSP